MEKKITIADFVAKYTAAKSDTAKEQIVKLHIKNRYIPYEEKCEVCYRIVQASSYIAIGDRKVFHQDMAANYMLYALNIVDLYTDIEVDFSKALELFNLLDKHDLIDAILRNMSDSERSKIDTILKMKRDDLYENERSLSCYAGRLADTMNIVAEEFMKGFNSVLEEKYSTAIQEVLNKKNLS